jgi:hypothetical protein
MYMTLTVKFNYDDQMVQFKSAEISQMKVLRPEPREDLKMEAGLFMSLASI